METAPDRSVDRVVLWPCFDQQAPVPAEPSPWFADAVRRAVADCLTTKQREAVELHYFCGLSEAAVAERLGVRQQVVHKRLHGVVRDGRRVGGALRRLHAALLPLAHAARWTP